MTVLNPIGKPNQLASDQFPGGAPVVLAKDDGSYVTVWWQGGALFRANFDAFGQTLQPPTFFSVGAPVNQLFEASLASDGGIRITASIGDSFSSKATVFTLDADFNLVGSPSVAGEQGRAFSTGVVSGSLQSKSGNLLQAFISDDASLGANQADVYLATSMGGSFGAPVRVNTATSGIQRNVGLEDIGGDRYLVTWTNDSNALGSKFGRIVDGSGAFVTGPFATANTAAAATPIIAGTNDGFVAVWIGSTTAVSPFEIPSREMFIRFFDGNGNGGAAIKIDASPTIAANGDRTLREITDVEVPPDGRIAIVADDLVLDGPQAGTRGAFLRIVSTDGQNQVPPLELDGAAQGALPEIAVLENGKIAAIWREAIPNSDSLAIVKTQIIDVVYTEAGDVRTLDATTNQSIDLGVGTDFAVYNANRAGFQIYGADSAGNAAEIVRLYDAFLGRAPDAGGFNYWLGQLNGGQTLQQIAQSFAGSGEFASYWGNISNRAFVEEIYERVLERTGDKGGVDYWTGRVNTDGRAAVLLEIAQSEEAKQLPGAETYVRAPNGSFDRLENVERVVFNDGIVALDTGRGEHAGEAIRLYDMAFDRGADRGGLTWWTQQLDAGASLTSVAQAFIDSAEGASLRNASNADFVKLLYQRGLDRPADAGGLAYWTGRVAADGKAAVLAEMSESAEHVAVVDPKISAPVLLDKYTLPGS